MTDPIPPYELDEVVVRGQRRRPGGAFPAGPGGGGGAGDGGGEYQNEVGENDPPPDQVDPCADPATALPWNADAAGAATVAKFLLKAAEIGFADAPNGLPSLLNREFGSFLVRGSGQSVSTGPVTAGPPPRSDNPELGIDANHRSHRSNSGELPGRCSQPSQRQSVAQRG